MKERSKERRKEERKGKEKEGRKERKRKGREEKKEERKRPCSPRGHALQCLTALKHSGSLLNLLITEGDQTSVSDGKLDSR